MEINYTLLVTLFMITIIVDSAGADLEVKVSLTNNSNLNEKTGELGSDIDSNGVDKVNMGEDQKGGLKEGVQKNNLDSSNSSKQLGFQEDHQKQQGMDGSVSGSEKKENSNEGSISKEVPKVGTSLPVRKESPFGDECDPSNRCTDEKNALVACLRVPGNDSPDLSLLIQNKGTGPLSVIISAPEFVRIESTKYQLQEKENKKVKVSIRNGGNDNWILLTAGNGNCSLDFRDLIMHDLRKGTDYTSQSTNIKFIKRIPSFALLFFAALVLALALMFLSFQRGKSSKYGKLDMELPVSAGPKTESDANDTWDNSWGDSWDDEEALKTPSVPVTPSLSSKGLASRRLNKDGWKD